MSGADVFMKRAEEFIEQAKDAFVKERYNVTAFTAGQAVINANDALTIKFLGKRARRDHKEALKLNKAVINIVKNSEGRRFLRELLNARHVYGYTKKSCSKTEAERLLRNGNKFISWVRKFV